MDIIGVRFPAVAPYEQPTDTRQRDVLVHRISTNDRKDMITHDCHCGKPHVYMYIEREFCKHGKWVRLACHLCDDGVT